MPIAAVPHYLQAHDPEFYLSAPPGHRFLLYFAAWGENQEANHIDWRMNDRVPKMKRQRGQLIQQGWEDLPNDQYACTIAACKTPCYEEDRPRKRKPKPDPGLKPWLPMMAGLLKRQLAAVPLDESALLRLDVTATAPFTTGLGNEHPLENGFAFLNPYGLPYLPGSGVKGVLRQAARELASGEWGETHGWSDAPVYPLFVNGKPVLDSNKQPVVLSMLDVLFGRETPSGQSDHVRGALSFWDVIPQIAGDSLMVEIMTPHQAHYYQAKPAPDPNDRRAYEKWMRATASSLSPHDSGQPTPISFLTVPPGSGFTFIVTCDGAHLKRLAPALAEPDENGQPRWKALMTAAFEHAFEWLGFGAKTAVGYGAMRRDTAAEERAAKARAEREAQMQRERQEAERQARLASLTPNLRLVEEFKAKAAQRKQQLGNNKDKPNTGLHSRAIELAKAACESGEWSAEEKRALAEAIEVWLPQLIERFDRKDDWKEARKKLRLAALKGEA